MFFPGATVFQFVPDVKNNCIFACIFLWNGYDLRYEFLPVFSNGRHIPTGFLRIRFPLVRSGVFDHHCGREDCDKNRRGIQLGPGLLVVLFFIFTWVWLVFHLETPFTVWGKRGEWFPP
ncbi:MAG: hypothetical protein JJU29_00245 [Verrucomicrobia bacterium]|nr:hypothetical protein [Verrucomicrobiota bacterium]MCH8511011.1 hypothetical protein [Kiritimatiellia bacterium]